MLRDRRGTHHMQPGALPRNSILKATHAEKSPGRTPSTSALSLISPTIASLDNTSTLVLLRGRPVCTLQILGYEGWTQTKEEGLRVCHQFIIFIRDICAVCGTWLMMSSRGGRVDDHSDQHGLIQARTWRHPSAERRLKSVPNMTGIQKLHIGTSVHTPPTSNLPP